MSRKLFIIPAVSLLMTVFFSGVVSAEDFGYFSLDVGSSFRMGDGGVDWLPGSTISTAWTYRINSVLSSGLNLSFNSWSPCCKNITEDFNSMEKRWVTKGSYDVIEIAPYLRVFPDFLKHTSFGGYFQVGSGLYIVDSNWSVINGYGLEHNFFGDKHSGSGFGFNVGGGVTFGDRTRTHYEFSPKYNVIFDGSDTVGYLGLSIGLLGPER